MDSYPDMKQLESNPSLAGLARMRSGIVYSEKGGEALTLDLLFPWDVEQPELAGKKYPLLVFVQGSGWTTPDREYEIPQLSAYAREGYVVATVGHRDYTKGHPFPAFLQDVKCAIRFLRKNADVYEIDPERVSIWGTSSGGNTALLVGLTGDDPRYKTPEYAECSDAVRAVISCFGPTDIVDIAKNGEGQEGFSAMVTGLYGNDPEQWPEKMREMSPIYQVDAAKQYPPFLLFHGDADPVVAFDQMENMYHRLLDCGAAAEAYRIHGGIHEGNFWSEQVHEVVRAFLQKNG